MFRCSFFVCNPFSYCEIGGILVLLIKRQYLSCKSAHSHPHLMSILVRTESFKWQRFRMSLLKVLLWRGLCSSLMQCALPVVLQRTSSPRMQENVQSAWRSWCRETPSLACPASASTIKGMKLCAGKCCIALFLSIFPSTRVRWAWALFLQY